MRGFELHRMVPKFRERAAPAAKLPPLNHDCDQAENTRATMNSTTADATTTAAMKA